MDMSNVTYVTIRMINKYKYQTRKQRRTYSNDSIDLPLKMEPIECSETSAISTQTPAKHPKENILQRRTGFSVIGTFSFYGFLTSDAVQFCRYVMNMNYVYVNPDRRYR
jgi:hypothetical protein